MRPQTCGAQPVALPAHCARQSSLLQLSQMPTSWPVTGSCWSLSRSSLCAALTHRVWLAISGKAYDVTKFLCEHPGGEEVMMEVTGAAPCSSRPPLPMHLGAWVHGSGADGVLGDVVYLVCACVGAWVEEGACIR